MHRLGSCLRFALGSRDLNAKRKQRAAQRTAPATLLFGSSSSILVTMTSVVSIKPAMLAALVRADLVTRVGSTMPALNISTYLRSLASSPILGDFSPAVMSSSAT